jgi:putative PEP-CTERM system TPR-repeat lipoprotein
MGKIKFINRIKNKLGSTLSTSQNRKKTSIAVVLLISLFLSACTQKTSQEHIAAAAEFYAGGDVSAAVVELKNAIQLDPKLANARFELGKIYLEQKSFEAAEKELSRAQDLGYPEVEVLPLLARAYQRTGANTALVALDHEMEGLTVVARAEVGFLKAQSLLQLNKVEEARVLVQDIQVLETSSVYKGLAGVLQLIIEQENEGALQQSIELQKQAPLNKDLLSLTARLYLVNEQPAEAADIYAEYVKAEPEDAETRFILARMLIDLNRGDEAEPHVDTLLKINDKNALLNKLKGIVRAADQDFVNGQKYSEIAINNGSLDPISRLVAGYSAYQQADFEGAVGHLSTIATSLPDNHPGLRILAASQLQTGLTSEASDLLRRLGNLTSNDASLFSKAGYELVKRGENKRAAEIIQLSEGLSDDTGDLTRLGVLKLSINNIDGILDLESAVEKSPESVTAKSTLATAYMASNQLDKASELASEWKNEASNLPEGFLLAGEVALRNNDLVTAESEFLRASAIAPNNTKVQMALIGLELRKEDVPAAISKLEPLLEESPDYVPALTAYYALKNREGSPEKGLEPILSQLSKTPENNQLLVLLSQIYVQQSEYENALDTLNKVTEDKVLDTAYWGTKGTVLLRLNKLAEADEHYTKWLSFSPSNRDAAMGKLLLLDSRNDYQVGLTLTQDYLESREDPQMEVLQSYFLIMTGKVKEAQSLIDSFDPNVKNLPLVRGVTARIKLRQGDAKGAVDDAKAAYDDNPSTKSVFLLAQAYDLSGQEGESVSLLSSYLENNPNDLRVMMLLAEKKIGSDKNSSINMYKDALKLDENNAVVLNNLAYLLTQEGQLDEAAGLAQRAFELNPNSPAVADTYAQIQVKQGNTEDAVETYSGVMNQEVDNEEIFLNYVEALLLNGSKEIAKRRITERALEQEKSKQRLASLKAKFSI